MESTLWQMRSLPPRAQLEAVSRSLGVPPLAAAVYIARGLSTPGQLTPPLELLALNGLEQAAQQLIQAVAAGRRIRIHGDYDADGLTGTAILVRGLQALGGRVHSFIPHRLTEGYGVLPERVPEHIEAADVFVTVDCGISNHLELAQLVAAGCQVIVTDHHTPGSPLPPGLVVHPALSPALQGQPHPTGAGVAFLLLWEIHRQLGLPAPLEYTDLAALGTVADVAPLLGFNRALVQVGLQQLSRSAHPGLAELASQQCSRFDATEIAFRLAPRINAASRLGQADLALELMLTSDPYATAPLVEALNTLNARRQSIEAEMLERVWPSLDLEAPALVVHDPQGHPGVMGIVASRILEKLYRPVFIVAQGKGSVRSTVGISAVGALRQAAATLKRFGGHAQAAGFAIDPARVEVFRQQIYSFVAQYPTPVPQLLLEGSLHHQDWEPLYQALQALQPFGEANPEPVFHLRGEPTDLRPMGEGKHLSFRISGKRVIQWRATVEQVPQPQVEVAATLGLNEFQGRRSIELQARQLRVPADFHSPHPVWAFPVAAQLASLPPGLPVYVANHGVEFLRQRGLEPVAAEQAQIWFSLPPRAVCLPRIEVALTERTQQELLAVTDPFVLLAAQRVVQAYRYKSPTLLGEAITAWWDAVQEAGSSSP